MNYGVSKLIGDTLGSKLDAPSRCGHIFFGNLVNQAQGAAER